MPTGSPGSPGGGGKAEGRGLKGQGQGWEAEQELGAGTPGGGWVEAVSTGEQHPQAKEPRKVTG